MTDKQKRNLYYWLNVLLANLAPLIILGVKYKVIGPAAPSVGYTVTILGIVGVIWTLFKFWSDLVDWVYNLDEGMFRETLVSTAKLGPYVLIIVVVIVSKLFLDDVQFIAFTLGVGRLFGTFFSAKHQFYKRKLQVARGDRRVLSDGRKRK